MRVKLLMRKIMSIFKLNRMQKSSFFSDPFREKFRASSLAGDKKREDGKMRR